MFEAFNISGYWRRPCQLKLSQNHAQLIKTGFKACKVFVQIKRPINLSSVISHRSRLVQNQLRFVFALTSLTSTKSQLARRCRVEKSRVRCLFWLMTFISAYKLVNRVPEVHLDKSNSSRNPSHSICIVHFHPKMKIDSPSRTHFCRSPWYANSTLNLQHIKPSQQKSSHLSHQSSTYNWVVFWQASRGGINQPFENKLQNSEKTSKSARAN